MKRFLFPLRPLAKLRAHLESSAREAFAVAVRTHTNAEEELKRASEAVARLESLVIEGRQRSFSPAGEARNLGAYRSELVVEGNAEKTRSSARTAMDQRRSDYVEAHRRLEVVRRLEEKARATHRLATNREEQAEFDDLAGRRAARKTHSES